MAGQCQVFTSDRGHSVRAQPKLSRSQTEAKCQRHSVPFWIQNLERKRNANNLWRLFTILALTSPSPNGCQDIQQHIKYADQLNLMLFLCSSCSILEVGAVRALFGGPVEHGDVSVNWAAPPASLLLLFSSSKRLRPEQRPGNYYTVITGPALVSHAAPGSRWRFKERRQQNSSI